jgi:7-cyano-7-deazaguanine synthase
LCALQGEAVEPLALLQMPLEDVHHNHWSLTGIGVPDAQSPDPAVYLPGRNALLLVKAALCCQSQEIDQLAVGVLGTSPFADAKSDFFAQFTSAMNTALGANLQIHRPFAGASKSEVMQLGRDLPLKWTFSCVSPQQQLHCGQCNKCAERRLAFERVGLEDPTQYASIAPLTK